MHRKLKPYLRHQAVNSRRRNALFVILGIVALILTVTVFFRPSSQSSVTTSTPVEPSSKHASLLRDRSLSNLRSKSDHKAPAIGANMKKEIVERSNHRRSIVPPSSTYAAGPTDDVISVNRLKDPHDVSDGHHLEQKDVHHPHRQDLVRETSAPPDGPGVLMDRQVPSSTQRVMTRRLTFALSSPLLSRNSQETTKSLNTTATPLLSTPATHGSNNSDTTTSIPSRRYEEDATTVVVVPLSSSSTRRQQTRIATTTTVAPTGRLIPKKGFLNFYAPASRFIFRSIDMYISDRSTINSHTAPNSTIAPPAELPERTRSNSSSNSSRGATCDRFTSSTPDGLLDGEPIDSVVWLSFDVPVSLVSNHLSTLEKKTSAAPLGEDIEGAAYAVGKQLIIDAMASAPDDVSSDYHVFFQKYNATLFSEGDDENATAAKDDTGAHIIDHNNGGRDDDKKKNSADAGECKNVPLLQPVQLDVVYTYVNNTSPSHIESTRIAGIDNDPARFRDWNELMYSMRGVYNFAMCVQTKKKKQRMMSQSNISHNNKSTATPIADCVRGTMIRKIHVVVAHPDQVPSWLKEDHPLVNVVLHGDIFPEEDLPFLPTFNSHSIEAAIHRIPGLSRFYVYFNNDMFWARGLSWFDYFRPLSAARQQHRVSRLSDQKLRCWKAAGLAASSLESAAGAGPSPTTTSAAHDDDHRRQEEDGSRSSFAEAAKDVDWRTVIDHSSSIRVTFLLEPILYFENNENPHQCRVWPRDVIEKQQQQQRDTTAVTTTTDAESPNAVDEDPGGYVYRQEFFGVSVNLSSRVIGDPSSTASPSSCDRRPIVPSALFSMQCPFPRYETPTGKKTSKQVIWRNFVYNNMAVQFKRMPGAHWPTHSFAHIPRLMDRHLMQRMQEVDLQDLSTQTRRSKERMESSLWTTHVHQWYALAHRRAVDYELVLTLSTSSALETKTTKNTTTTSHWRNPLSSVQSSERVTMLNIRPSIDELYNHRMSLEPLRFASSDQDVRRITKLLTDSSQEWGQHTRIEPTSNTSLLEEKLNFHVVRLDRKRGGYYFCMMRSLAIQQRCLSETVGSRQMLGGVQLFVTVNDDFPRMPNQKDAMFLKTAAGARDLFAGLSGDAPPAPWER